MRAITSQRKGRRPLWVALGLSVGASVSVSVFDARAPTPTRPRAPTPSLARDREPARSGTYLQATAGSQRHFSLAKVLLSAQPQFVNCGKAVIWRMSDEVIRRMSAWVSRDA
jgi:hypothetical protein